MQCPEVLAVIGARSGSRGVTHKNIKPLLGKPLMGWIIEAASHSAHVTRIVLSSDSAEYGAIGRQFGAEAPFLRPVELAGDLSTDYDYVRHALEWLHTNENYEPDVVVRLLPTTPLTRPKAIDETIELLFNDVAADSSILVTESHQTPFKMYVPGPDPRYLEPLLPQPLDAETAPVPRQLLPRAYVRGNMIASRRATVMDKHSLFGATMRYHVVPYTEAIDIDHDYDFVIAEALLRQRHENS